jgi:hypothetical protein
MYITVYRIERGKKAQKGSKAAEDDEEVNMYISFYSLLCVIIIGIFLRLGRWRSTR